MTVPVLCMFIVQSSIMTKFCTIYVLVPWMKCSENLVLAFLGASHAAITRAFYLLFEVYTR